MSEHFFSHNQINKPEHCLKLERWQGPPNINKVKHYETVLSFKVSLFIKFILAVKKKKSMMIFLFCSAPLR